MKYFLGEITEAIDGIETNSKFVFAISRSENPEQAINAIAKSFRSDDDEEVKGSDGDYMVDGYIRVKAGMPQQIPQPHFEVLKLYLSDLTIQEGISPQAQ